MFKNLFPLFLQVRQELGAFFSLRGHSRLLDSRSCVAKALYLLCMLALLAACLFYARQNYRDFKDYNVVTQIKIREDSGLPFPAITLCLYNARDRSLAVALATALNDCFYDTSANKFSKVSNQAGFFYFCEVPSWQVFFTTEQF